MMDPAKVAEMIVKVLDDKKARDIKMLKIEAITVLANYFVICTATSSTHIQALADEVEKRLSEAGEPLLRQEGYRGGEWVLLDFGCVILHLFLPKTREFYNLEHLWSDAPEVDISSIIV